MIEKQWNEMIGKFPLKDIHKPMDELDNPYREVCVVLYMYSMELGSPPLYAVLNVIVR